MINGNISMEEDTELRDLVVQTLENNGVLAKVRAELRASVFLTLEEQESVLNPEPFLNKSVKQYLATSEGKLLFSLVREFLEYFGLDYTMSVYDPETYFGKEYNYEGRKKLCEDLGISSKEPLLGEILKNMTNSALNNTQKSSISNLSNAKLDKTNEISETFANATFDVSVPKILQKNDSVSFSNESSEKLDTASSSNLIPINVTIKDKKITDNLSSNETLVDSVQIQKSSTTETSDNENVKSCEEKIIPMIEYSKNVATKNEIDSNLNHSVLVTTAHSEVYQNQEVFKNRKSKAELKSVNNVKNTKQIDPMNSGKTVYFDEIILDGKKEKMKTSHESELLLGELPPLQSTNNTVFGDLPPLNGNKTNINDFKELIDIAQGISQFEEDSPSSASGSASEQSPLKNQNVPNKTSKISTAEEEFVQNLQSENESQLMDRKIKNSKNIESHVVL